MAIHPSPRFVFLLLFVHLLAAWAAYVAVLPLFVKFTLALLVISSLSWHLARDALLLLSGSWVRLSIEGGEAIIVNRQGLELTGKILDSSVVTPWLVLLRIVPDGNRWPVARVVFRDALRGDDFRTLCVRLRFR